MLLLHPETVDKMSFPHDDPNELEEYLKNIPSSWAQVEPVRKFWTQNSELCTDNRTYTVHRNELSLLQCFISSDERLNTNQPA